MVSAQKNHVLADALGNPMKFILTGGKKSDFLQALPVIAGEKADAVLADKGYDASYIVAEREAMGAEANIPPKSKRKTSRKYDLFLYKVGNVIERMFNKMKQFCGIATR